MWRASGRRVLDGKGVTHTEKGTLRCICVNGKYGRARRKLCAGGGHVLLHTRCMRYDVEGTPLSLSSCCMVWRSFAKLTIYTNQCMRLEVPPPETSVAHD